MQTSSIDLLRGIPIFSEFTEKELTAMADCSWVSTLPRNSLIFREGDPYYGLYVVISGAVKVYKLTQGGRETLLHIIRPLNTLGEIPMFLGGGYPAYASTLEESTLLCVYKDGFMALLHDNVELSLRMLAGLSRRLKDLRDHVEKLTAYDVRDRLARYLLEENTRGVTVASERAVRLNVSKKLLAAQLGTAVETLSRAFHRLENEGLLRISGRTIFLPDPERLRRSIED